MAEVPLIVTPPGSSGRRLLEAALGREGLCPLVAIETSQREAILPLVLAAAEAAVMPEAIAMWLPRGLAHCPVFTGCPCGPGVFVHGGLRRLRLRRFSRLLLHRYFLPHGDQGSGKRGHALAAVRGGCDHEDGEGDGEALGPDLRGDPAPATAPATRRR